MSGSPLRSLSKKVTFWHPSPLILYTYKCVVRTKRKSDVFHGSLTGVPKVRQECWWIYRPQGSCSCSLVDTEEPVINTKRGNSLNTGQRQVLMVVLGAPLFQSWCTKAGTSRCSALLYSRDTSPAKEANIPRGYKITLGPAIKTEKKIAAL